MSLGILSRTTKNEFTVRHVIDNYEADDDDVRNRRTYDSNWPFLVHQHQCDVKRAMRDTWHESGRSLVDVWFRKDRENTRI